jgi:hypothetical protein
MLSPKATLIIGNGLISIDILHRVLSTSSKLFHGLIASDIDPRDHQNFASCYRISRDEVFQALETVKDSNATFIYLKLLRSIIDAYIEEDMSLLERVYHAWISMFVTRIWLVWTDKMGKQKLDKLLTRLTTHWEKLPHRSKNSTQQFFLTPPAVYSIELNAHCLTYLALLVIEGKLPDEVLAVDRFHSQTSEATFRSARAFSSPCSSGVNFTVLKFMNLAEKLSLFQKIKTQNEQLSSPDMRFPVHHKHKHSQLSSTLASSLTPLRSKKA